MSSSKVQESGSVAVIGMSGRFPGAPDVAGFWRNLRDGVEAARELAQDELEAAGVDAELLSDPRYVRTGVVLEDVERFDAAFFGLSPREAELMDPQHRLLLECAWEALEDAGYDAERAPGEVGVFTSALMSYYLLLHILPRRELMRRVGGLAARIFNDKDFLPTRVSYKLNLRGPSMAVQTACSSSLVGCHLACQSLLNLECDMALVGGVALNLPQAGYLYQEGSIYSPDGHCRAFDSRAQGTINGSGAGVVVLRRLEDAVAAGDRIRAVIRGTAVNNDGSLKVGFTAPSVEGQAAVVAAALEFAGVDPDTLGLIEAHGTGTPMGDPIEVAALTQVFRETTARRGFCALGSVKASIGHLDAAAGVAGLIKAALALEHKVIPPAVNCDQPSPELDLPSTPFYVTAEAKPWLANGTPRRAGVTSLGVGGTNAHVVLEEAPPRPASGASRPWQLLVWSARDAQGLEDATGRLAAHLESGPAGPLADLAFTLQTGRAAFARRRALACRGPEDALEALRGSRRWLEGGDASGEPEVAFLFPGQGSQHPGMGRELYRSEPVYREVIDDCAERLRPHLGLDLRTLLDTGDAAGEEAARQLQQTRIAQPALFAVEYAMARLWMDWGVTPRALLGHSVGEYVAACLAGVLTLADALELVAVRGRLMQSLPPGAMLSVALAAGELEPLLDARLSLAALNAEAVTTVAGPADAVEALAARLTERKVEHRRLRTSHAFHSAMVEPVVGAFVEQAARMKLRPPQMRLLSNVSGTWMTPQEATDPRYWGQQLRRPVRFSAAVQELLREPGGALLEVGPGQALTRLARLHRQGGQVPWAVASMRHPQQEGSDLEQLLGALGRLWTGGVRIDWKRFSRFERRQRVAAPTYPFQRQRYWIEPVPAWGGEEPAPPEVSLPDPRPESPSEAGPAMVAAPLELAVAGVWREVLGVERIAAGDDFFELGGNSLSASQVTSRLWETLGIQVAVQDLFTAPTVAGLAARLSAISATRLAEPAGEEPVPAELPLSYSQHRFWVLDQLLPGNPAYNMLVPLRLRGELSVAALAASWREVARRHESLRTRFELSGKAPVRVVSPGPPLDVPVIGLEGLPAGVQEAEVARLIRAERNRPFDLARGPLMRASLLRLGAREHVLLPSFHHIVFDGWSLYVLVAELAALIPAAVSGSPSPLPEPAARFSDFVRWQRQRMQGDFLESELGFWRDRLAGIPRVLDLPADFPRPSVQGPQGASRFFVLPSSLTAALQALGRSRGATLFMTLLAAFQTLLYRATGEERFLVGTPVAGRGRAGVEGLIGCFVNTLVIPGDVSGRPGFGALLERAREVVLASLGHQDLPFERLVDELQPERDLSRNPLFQVMLILQNARPPKVELPGLAIDALSLDTGTAKFDLTLAFVEDGTGEVEGLAEYRTDLFLAPTILRFLSHFESLLWAAVADPERPVAELPLLSEAERHQLAVDWNDSAGAVEGPELLHGMFERQAAQSPESRALTFGESGLTYRQLNARANQLAHWLVRQGVGPEVRVGIQCERSLEMVVAMLAVHKAGGAYVPMDPSYPEERLALVLEDAGASLVLTRRRLDELAGSLEHESEDDPTMPVRPDNAAYVIYTSGSTGRPKGVVVTHRAAANFFAAMDRRINSGGPGVWLAVTSISFDISVLELLWTLARGFEVVVQPEAAGVWPVLERLERLPGITHLQCTPSMARLLVAEPAGAEALGPLRRLLVGGEALPPALARQLRGAVRGELHNMYGPTETTVWSSTHRVEEVSETVPIGRPLLNTGLFILDHGFEPVPAGIPGELFIGGRGVVRGYLGRPDLTAERFLPDPFAAEAGSRFYATGDRARWRPDGSVEFLGRVDHQVKIRGHRIEPGEIERALDRLPEVGESVVVLGRDGGGEAVLVAYVAGADGTVLSPQGLRESLRRWLPEPMVPSRYVLLAALPRTPNGKVDRRALPAPEWEKETGRDYVAPRTPLEEALAAVWSEVLGIERVGARDNFFELGGDSIQSLWVRSLAQQRGVGLSVQQLFQHPTVESLAAALAAEGPRAEPVRRVAPFELVSEADRALLPEGLEDAYPLTALQMGMLFYSELDAAAATYHDVFSYHLRAPLEPGELSAALERLVARHPVLRTGFGLESFSEPLQLVYPAMPVAVTVEDLDEAAISDWLAAERLKPFDWTRPPLLRLHVHRRSADSFQLTLSFHHAILDGWSVATLLTELFRDYLGQGQAAAPQALMRDYVAQEREALKSEESRQFWVSRVEEAPLTALPVWPGSGPAPQRRAERLRFEVPAQVADGLHEMARQLGIPVKSVLLAAHLRVLALIGGQGEVTTGLVLNARPEEIDGERVLGLFLNSLPFRLDAGPGSWPELAQRAFEEERALLAHRLYPLAQIQREAGGRPLFETLFNFIHFHVYQALAGVESLELLGSTIFEETNYPLVANFAVDSAGTGLLVDLVYDAARVAPAQAQALAGYYSRALSRGESLLSAAERHQLVLEWNDTGVLYPAELETLHGWIEAQAARMPEAPAVAFEGERLTYGELNRRADHLADRLQELGVGPDVLVGVSLERSLELMVALVGVLKAGGAYVPLDPGYPAERLSFMVEDSGVAVLLTGELLARLESSSGPFVQRPRVSGESLAYMIYTSGSTGRPKGAMNSHRAIVNRLLWMQEAYGLTAEDRVLQKTPLSFDVSVWELFWPLMTGACLVMARPEGHRDSAYLKQVIAAEGVTTLHFVPSMLRAFLEEEGVGESCTGLKRVMASGEALPLGLVERFHALFPAGTAELHNLYGPTEAAVDVTSWWCGRESGRGPIPIGKPIANLRTHVVDRELRPVALGVAGELLLGGVGLARGYWRRPDQTAERFMPDPLGMEPGSRLYRTGDLARYLPDGAIEYLGRLDHQVKVRGFRIELGEIEVALSAHPAIGTAVVLAREDRPGEKRLVAYAVARGEALPEPAELSAFLGRTLPEHMVPSAFVWLPSLPLTPSGKLDRRALPAPEIEEGRDYVAPRTALEETLAAVWSEVLGVERVGIHDSFFALGGDSINSLRVRALAQRRGIGFALPQLFQHPTVESLAAALSAEGPWTEPVRRVAPFELVSEADRALLPEGLEDAYPLTALQMGMLFYSELDAAAATYHDVFSYHLRAPLEPGELSAALERLVARHPVLRTGFDLESFSEPLQLVYPAMAVAVTVEDLDEASLSQWLAAERLKPFDWTRPPLLRLHVHRRSTGSFQLTVSFHHAILDGWSVATLLTELFRDYLGQGRAAFPQALVRDYVAQEREALKSEESRQFWASRVEEAPLTALPVWPGFGPQPQRRAERLRFEVPAQVADGLHEMARRLGIPVKSVLLAAHLRVLALIGGQDEVTTGLVLNARPEEIDGERVLGLFLNSLPFRLDSGSWPDLALRAFEEERALLAHRLYPLAQIQREAGGRPLFETLFNFIHFHVYQALAGVESLELLGSTIFEETNYPLVANFAFDSSGTGLLVDLVYDAARVAPAQAQTLAGYYSRALSPGESLLSAAERHQLVLEWNDSAVCYAPWPETLQGWIEAQAARTPEAPAVLFEEEGLSYGELNRRADHLADRLQELGVGPDVLVGVSLERSLELMVALLGVLKAGGAYVPLDPGYPAERLSFMVEDSGVAVLLTSELLARLENASGSAGRRPQVSGESLAYMIYTSGSTGRPKGAMNSHRAIVNRLLWMQEAYGLTAEDRVLQKTPLSFDVSVWELFWPLMTGACLVMARPEGHRDSTYLKQVIAAEGVTTLHFVPSMLRAFLEEEGVGESCTGLKRVMASGEALPLGLVERFHSVFPAGTAELHNLYGPTEAAVDVTSWWCDRENGRGLIPIGKPIANLRTHVVDRDLRPVALGVPGELLLGGVGLARGYWRRPDQTAERFIPDPLGNEPGGRLYRTGDLARHLPDGAIEYLGRLDHQVKVRGFRIELGEIEVALSAHPAVSQAVVLAREDRPGEKRLVAYAVARGEAVPERAELSAFLGTSLPEHMVPSAFVWLPSLPLTPSGKLDRRALPVPEQEGSRDYVAPRTALEETLAAVWSEVLGVERVGIHDSFFALGGDSINSLRVRAVAQRRGIGFALPQLFQHPTVEGLAAALAAEEPWTEPVRRGAPFELVSAADRALLPEGLEDAYPLTALQMGMLFYSELDAASATYHNVFSYHLRAPLEPGELSAALAALLSRHAVLRTGFDLKSFSEPLQLVHPAPLPAAVAVEDLADLDEAAQEAAVAQWLAAERREPFDWTRPPLLRLQVHRRSAGSFQITLSFHHAILDGWSVSTLLSELLRDYLQRVGVLAWSPEPAAPQALMRDYVALEREALTSGQARTFWAARLEDAPATALPSWLGTEADAMTERRAERLRFDVPAELAGGLHELARRLGIPVKSVLLAAHLRVLGLLSGSREVMTGVVVNGRPEEADGERVLGLFLNSVPMRSEVSEGSWADLARRAFEEERAMLPHRRYPMAQMQRDAGGQPLFGILFNFLHFRIYEVFAGSGGMDVMGDRIFEETNFPLEVTFSLGSADTEVQLEVIHDASQVLGAQAQAVASYCLRALAAMVRSPESTIGGQGLLSAPEAQQLLLEWNDTAVAYPPWPETLHGWIEAQVARTPDAPAVIFEEEHLTYRELDRQAGRLAAALRGMGVGPEVLVGVYLERSLELSVALLAVLKSGGAYVPLDPSYPVERLRLMIEDSRAPVLLTVERLASGLPVPGVRLVLLDREIEAAAEPGGNPPHVLPENLAYTTFTSGSTGRPKGAMNSHRGIVNRLLWMQQTYPLSSEDRVVQKTPLSFDDSAVELFWPLISGACLVMARPEGHRDSAYLRDLAARHDVAALIFVPSMLRAFLDEDGLRESCGRLRHVVASGEALPPELVERFHATFPPGTAELHNLYGPTEAAVDVSSWTCERGSRRKTVPIGRPIANLRLHVLDRNLQPVPAGVPGELMVGGVGLARGYWGRPDQTADRFIPDSVSGEPGQRLYRTGDLTRHLRDGAIEFLGRLDHQVKVRGFRIELEEIEGALARHPQIRQSVVLAREDRPGDKRLVAYLVTRDGDPDAAELRAFLGASLPDYMIPAAFVVLPELPLTPNGKLDRKALPAPDLGRLDPGIDYAAPRTSREAALAAIWAEVLGVERVGIHDSFFALGGDSILSIQVVSRAHRAGMRLTPRQLFLHPTVAELAPLADSTPMAVATQGAVTGPVPLMPIQEWFFELDLAESHHWNLAVLLEVRQPTPPIVLECALGALLLHHDALRLRFERDASGWRQRISEPGNPVPFTWIDLAALPEPVRKAEMERCAARLHASLDLTRGPLLRAANFRMAPETPDRLLLLIHHLAVDGVSWRILVEDLAAACEQLTRGEAVTLPPKTTSFQEWAERLVARARSGEQDAGADIAFWRRMGGPLVQPLPFDGHGDDTIGSARTLEMALDARETQALLQEVPQAYRTQIEDLLLTALAQALADWTGEKLLRVDLEAHGREELFPGVDLTRTVGWFTALFPVLLDLRGAEEPGAALKAVKEQLRAIPNRGIGYGLLRYLRGGGPAADALRGLPAAGLSFNYFGRLDQVLPAGSRFAPAREPSGPARSPLGRRSHPLGVDAAVTEGCLRVVWTYSPALHRPETVERLARGHLDALRALIAHCRTPGVGGYTPSDFRLAEVNQTWLDRLARGGRKVEDVYPLSPMQEGMLFHTLSDPQPGMYFQQIGLALEGPLDAGAFARAWWLLLERHPALRTAFAWEGMSRPHQIVFSGLHLPWRDLDWRSLTHTEQEWELETLLEEDRRRGFELTAPPLMRLTLVRRAEEKHELVISVHHLLVDGWSLSLLVREAFELYRGLTAGGSPVAVRPRPYQDYIAWLLRQDLDKAAAFWRRSLAGFTAPTPLGIDRPVVAGLETGEVQGHLLFSLPPAATDGLQKQARQLRVTLNTIVQGAWALLLSRYSGERDVVFGVTGSGRPAELPDVESMVGLFINTLPARVEVDGSEPLARWLGRLQELQAEVRQYEYTPLTQIQGWSEVPRRLPLFESLFLFENFPIDSSLGQSSGGVEIRGLRTFQRTNYPLVFAVVPGESLSMRLSYDRRRFAEVAVGRLAGHLTMLLEALAEPPGRLDDLPVLSPAERDQLLREWQGEGTESAELLCVHRLFEARAASTPQAPALAYEERVLTYRELNRQANRLAHRLRDLGVGPEVRVGLCSRRSPEMIVGLLAVLKAGGAYLPLDPGSPAERLRLQLEDAGAPVVLAQPGLADGLAEGMPLRLDLTAADAVGEEWDGNVDGAAAPHNAVYVLYTSGSTGLPKGVVVEHGQLFTYVRGVLSRLGLPEAASFATVSTLAADLGNTAIFPALASGGCLHLISEERAVNPEAFADYFEREAVDCLKIVPSHFKALWRSLGSRRSRAALPRKRLIFGGEASLRQDVEELRELAPECAVFNHYGPTESTVGVLTLRVDEEDLDSATVPLGRPIPGARVYVLDREQRLLPAGLAGELCIAGATLARGYLNRPGMTAERFVPDPWSGEPGGRMYRTGDLAVHLPDGKLLFLGRIDHQIKIRGFRVEPGEIEEVLRQYPGVQEALVLAHEGDPGELRLTAFLVAAREAEVTADELRALARRQLPEHMVPSGFVLLEALPLTPNGKVDRQALLALAETREPADGSLFEPPVGELEQALAEIWSEVLGGRRIGRHDNYFDLGGHSLTAIPIMSRLRDKAGVELPLGVLFESPTIAGLAARVEEIRAGRAAAATVMDLAADAALDPAIRPHGVVVTPMGAPAAVLLTGATGLLGAFLLDELLNQTEAEVYCLVRASGSEEAGKRVRRALESHSLSLEERHLSRIVPLAGDLSRPLLGLGPDRYRELAGRLDSIYHNGALVNFAYPYPALRAANVLGTQEVLRLASEGPVKAVHHVSTIDVFFSQAFASHTLIREDDEPADSKGLAGGYVQSKWVAERLVAAARDRSMPASIFRPARVSWHSHTGAWSTTDLLSQVMRACLSLGCAPELDWQVDIVPVDYVSRAIVHLSLQESSLGRAFHMVHPRPVSWMELVGRLNDCGCSLRTVPLAEWRARLAETPDPALAPLHALTSGWRAELPETERAQASSRFDSRQTWESLAGTGISCPPVDGRLLEAYLKRIAHPGTQLFDLKGRP